MSDLINRRVAIKAIVDLPNCYNGFSDTYDKAYIIGALEELPTIDAMPVKHGKWIYGEHDIAMCDGYRCSNCGYFVPWDYSHKSIDYIEEYKYCPFCGARMDKDD